MNSHPFNDIAPFEAGSDTSRAAAKSLSPVQLGSLRGVILVELDKYPSTCDGIEILTGLSHQTASARIRELYMFGMIEKIGKGITRTGRKADLWITSDLGRKTLKDML